LRRCCRDPKRRIASVELTDSWPHLLERKHQPVGSDRLRHLHDQPRAAKSRFEESDDAVEGVCGHWIGIGKVETVVSAGIDDVLGLSSNCFAELHQFLALGGRNVAIRRAVKFDQRRQVLDFRHHRIRHAAVQHTQRGNALVARGRGGGNVAAQREAKQADAA
jgi:hypothetical protein